ncbi:hydroxymethylglutaryl-CoA lyase [Fusibacter paucivorans]|uniref:Hydroxymethylglutaryl-CoA lyase n=1 Tax=Fusibacter paucivorans TaxID=76009 RepID=A0ABS5PLN0_9FIRM|nr:hydroxymethylglutaryl-CoA lyase [Fusibacter paucivorans]MBS7526073.1 hydroxymethylglutaryl-CoA lyase [Fusibacter paucivorans]
MIGMKDVSITEVGPRDGFQNIKTFIETEDKLEIIRRMIDSGVKHLEVTSFVHPKWVPQMRDAETVVSSIRTYAAAKNLELIALVPNKFGALKAKAAGVDAITYVISVSEAHNKANVNRTIDESFEAFKGIVGEMGKVKIRLALATTFGCPFNEVVPVERIVSIAERGLRAGADKVILADTIGVADPMKVERILKAVTAQIDPSKLIVHFHDTRGMALANTLVALNAGIRNFEAASGGLGGCPFAPGAAGNVAMEDLLNMLHAMGYQTSISPEGIAHVVEAIAQKVDAPIISHMSKLGSCDMAAEGTCNG